MKERPILYSKDMILAKKAGLKTVTRRVVKPQPVDVDQPWPNNRSHITFNDMLEAVVYNVAAGYCPYGQPGDNLWTREAFRLPASLDSSGKVDLKFNWGIDSVIYRADQEDVYEATDWRPGIHMPRWASRFTDRITFIGIEQVQDITETDAKREGVQRDPKMFDTDSPFPTIQSYRTAYRYLWDKINKPEYSWEMNPFVWVIRFEPVQPLTIKMQPV